MQPGIGRSSWMALAIVLVAAAGARFAPAQSPANRAQPPANAAPPKNAAPPANPGPADVLSPPAHLKAALELVQSVSPQSTSYRHHEIVVEWRVDSGAASSVCHTDCSGLVDAVLKRSYGLTDANLRKWFKAKRPLARHYYEAIERKDGLQPIATVPAIRPGDLLAVRYENAEKGDNTGHVMIVAGAPRERTASEPLVNGTRQWEVKIVDQSSSGHGQTDTRRRPDGKKHGGVGLGVLRLYSDAAGNLVGYTWSTSRKSKFESPSARPMVVGRLDPEFVAGLKAGQ